MHLKIPFLSKKKKPKIGLALGGGGAKGLAHIYVLKALDELNIKPDVIAGCSMGALIGSLYASGLSGLEIEGIAKNFGFKNALGLLDFSIFNKTGLVKGNHVIKWLEQNLGTSSFSKLKIPLKIVATDFWNKKEVVFDKGNVVEAVRCSISIPGVFEPYSYKGNVFVDGGVVNPVPYDAIRDECDVLIAVDVMREKEVTSKKNTNKPKLKDLIYVYTIMYEKTETYKLQICKPDIYLRANPENISIFDFHKIKEVEKYVKDDIKKFKKELKKIF
ncbi:patatin-like phospholipase family protein [Candidatus Woesearchaeota archaeon]|nr:patatin-like phospholipase family protein [Candidatus Woesearchaeota archaeon]